MTYRNYTSDLEETKDKNFVIQMVHFLISSHLVGDINSLTPLPAYLKNSSDEELSNYILHYCFITLFTIL